jgi:HSP20 family protein
VALEIRGRQLIIAGERRAHESSNRLYQQIEIANGPFRRVVELGADVEADHATATYEDGILRIEIPLVQQTDEARRIRIESKAEELDEGG